MTTQFPPGTPSWIDLGTTDVAGATSFYSALFGWTVESLAFEAGDYGFFRKDGKMVAGIGQATDPDRGTSWSVYFATDDVDTSAKRVEAAGGTVAMPAMDIMDQGRMAVFQDPAGVHFSVWQPNRHTGAELVNETGSLCWTELMTSDIAGAKPFYASVLGVTTRDVEVSPDMTYTLLEVGGKSVAGAMQVSPEQSGGHSLWSVYIAVDDCDVTADKAVELGGTELMRDDSPAGRLAFLVDPQGGAFCIIKPDPTFSM
jgi:uncharacterized protein